MSLVNDKRTAQFDPPLDEDQPALVSPGFDSANLLKLTDPLV